MVRLWASPGWLGVQEMPWGRHLGFWEEQLQARAWQEAGLNPVRTAVREGSPRDVRAARNPIGELLRVPPRADWAMEGGRCVTKVGRALTLFLHWLNQGSWESSPQGYGRGGQQRWQGGCWVGRHLESGQPDLCAPTCSASSSPSVQMKKPPPLPGS